MIEFSGFRSSMESLDRSSDFSTLASSASLRAADSRSWLRFSFEIVLLRRSRMKFRDFPRITSSSAPDIFSGSGGNSLRARALANPVACAIGSAMLLAVIPMTGSSMSSPASATPTAIRKAILKRESI